MKYKNILSNNIPFDEISIPSKGIFYKNKKSSFLVRYLSAKEENILTSPTLKDSGEDVSMVMQSCILDWDGDINDLLVGDRDAFILYLRSTAYGDGVEYSFDCSKCKKENTDKFHLSLLEMKEIEDTPDEEGLYSFVLPNMKLRGEDIVIKFRPKTIGDEINIKKTVEKEKKTIGGNLIDNTIEITYRTQIISINGVKDKEFIKGIIKNMPLRDSSKLRDYMNKVEPGINDIVESECGFCGHISRNKININGNFFGINPEYRNNMMEEVFLMSYYGQGGFSRDDIYNMPVYERKWSLQRIQEEVEKKNEAERKAAQKAKSQSKRR